MGTSTISIEVDAESAQAYRQASNEDKRKLQMLLNLRLRELTTTPSRTLKEIMDEIGNRAEAMGMTPQLLDEILNDD